jgi:hypothetical protein
VQTHALPASLITRSVPACAGGCAFGRRGCVHGRCILCMCFSVQARMGGGTSNDNPSRKGCKNMACSRGNRSPAAHRGEGGACAHAGGGTGGSKHLSSVTLQHHDGGSHPRGALRPHRHQLAATRLLDLDQGPGIARGTPRPLLDECHVAVITPEKVREA